MKPSIRHLPFLALTLAATPSAAWEAESTHAGLTEQATLSSTLHATLADQYGLGQGLYTELTLPRSAAERLFADLGRVSPAGGFVPDARGRQTGLAWLVAGSVIEDMQGAKHHFYDPVRNSGLDSQSPRLSFRLWALWLGESSTHRGMAAPSWIVAPENQLGMSRFLSEMEAAVSTTSPKERDAHLALALVAAGAMTHVLEDMGSPSRVRGDYDEHLRLLGGGGGDRGSRFERLAALLYGKLGVPAPKGAPPARTHGRDFFTAADGQGLADITSSSWFSSGTLPGSTRSAEVTPLGPKHGMQRNPEGVCLANYVKLKDRTNWSIDDKCAAEQIAAILPKVAAHARAFLDWLFRGALKLTEDRRIIVEKTALGRGTLRIFAEDKDGNRSELGAKITREGGDVGTELGAKITGEGGDVGTELGTHAEPPVGTVKLVALFRGQDALQEEVVAVGARSLPR